MVVHYCNVKIRYCNVKVRYCSVYLHYCNVYLHYSNVTVHYCNVTVHYCNVSVHYCNVKVRYCNVTLQSYDVILQSCNPSLQSPSIISTKRSERELSSYKNIKSPAKPLQTSKKKSHLDKPVCSLCPFCQEKSVRQGAPGRLDVTSLLSLLITPY